MCWPTVVPAVMKILGLAQSGLVTDECCAQPQHHSCTWDIPTSESHHPRRRKHSCRNCSHDTAIQTWTEQDEIQFQRSSNYTTLVPNEHIQSIQLSCLIGISLIYCIYVFVLHLIKIEDPDGYRKMEQAAWDAASTLALLLSLVLSDRTTLVKLW